MVEKWIVCDPEILSGKPIIKGTRISVAIILGCLASGMSIDDIIKGYPTLSRESVLSAIEFTAREMSGEEIKIIQEV